MPDKVTLVNTQARLLVSCGVQIMPGTKEYDLEPRKLQELLANEQFQSWQQLGWVKRRIKATSPSPAPSAPAPEPVAPVVADDPGSALQELNLPEAEALIKECEDPELLAEWYDRDDRKGARHAIEERLKDLDALGD